jgi:hypothetical protein
VVVREEIVATPVPIDARPLRQIEPDVCIGQEQDSNVGRHLPILVLSVFVR